MPYRTKPTAPAAFSATVILCRSCRHRSLKHRVEAALNDDGAVCDADVSTISKFNQNSPALCHLITTTIASANYAW